MPLWHSLLEACLDRLVHLFNTSHRTFCSIPLFMPTSTWSCWRISYTFPKGLDRTCLCPHILDSTIWARRFFSLALSCRALPPLTTGQLVYGLSVVYICGVLRWPSWFSLSLSCNQHCRSSVFYLPQSLVQMCPAFNVSSRFEYHTTICIQW